MARRKRKAERQRAPYPAAKLRLRGCIGALVLGGGIITAGVAFAAMRPQSASPAAAPASQPATPQSVADLLAVPPEALEKLDLALVNLLCAKGLPGAEDLDIPATLKTLDRWAEQVRRDTDKYYPRFLKKPAANNNSEADFRMLTLITVLQLDLGVEYNPARIGDYETSNPDYSDARDQFMNGIVGGDHGGTCISMPVLYAVVARRLGYPVKLVLAKEHVFCRWQDAKERVNIEGAGRGMHTPADDYYRTWPKPISDEEVSKGEYLKSLTPTEELALCLRTRADCLSYLGRQQEARELYAEALKRMPQSRDIARNLELTDAVIAGRLVRRASDGALVPPMATQPASRPSICRPPARPAPTPGSKHPRDKRPGR